MTVDYEYLAYDLITRTDKAVEAVLRLTVDTGITFMITDIVDAVERELPAGYPAPASGDVTRRGVIEQMAREILNGEMYERT